MKNNITAAERMRRNDESNITRIETIWPVWLVIRLI